MGQLREGDRINNYLLERRVGIGTFGEVWRARHHVFGDIVAIKIPTDDQYVRNLQREGVTIHGLHHPNIVRALDMDPYADPPYLIMEFVDGPSLREAIEDRKREFPIVAAQKILRGILLALSAAHDKRVIHRDLKPANVLLHHPLGSLDTIAERAVKVTDFGLGCVSLPTGQSMQQSTSLERDEGDDSIVGTLAYMSPEQREGQTVDARSDLYSCGVLFFEMLTGERPQGHEVPSALRPEVSPGFDDIFRRSYTRLDRRFESAAVMNQALTAVTLIRSMPPLARPAADASEVAPRHRNHQSGATHPPEPHRVGVAPAHACVACGAAARGEDQFCIKCGQQLAERVLRCPQCKAYPKRSDRYCTFCGKDLRVLT